MSPIRGGEEGGRGDKDLQAPAYGLSGFARLLVAGHLVGHLTFLKIKV